MATAKRSGFLVLAALSAGVGPDGGPEDAPEGAPI
jgi:hypothetical protein